MEINVKQLSKIMDTENPPILIDIREAHELSISSIPQALHIPINQLGNEIKKYSADDNLVIMCRSGSRSHWATKMLIQAGYKNTKNLVGGINEWAKKIDNSISIY